ncbi:hypothetical protein, partial [Streptomyces himastatinicus]|uniref:hypothetical protein n=1 Tax=Streptomyces himastatinicus TaxID=998084 RepID=UPI0001B4D5B5
MSRAASNGADDTAHDGDDTAHDGGGTTGPCPDVAAPGRPHSSHWGAFEAAVRPDGGLEITPDPR